MGLRYRVYNDNLGFERDISPIGKPKITGKREENEFYFKKSIKELTIKSPDFEGLIQFETSFERFFIEVFCDSNLIFKGSFNFLTANICKDTCQMTFEIREESLIACLRRNDKETNVLSATITEVSSEIPELTNNLQFYMTIEYNSQVLPPFDPLSWGDYAFIAPIFAGVDLCCEQFGYQIYAREVVTERCLAGVPNNPVGTVLIQDNCAVDGTYTYAKPYTGTTYNYITNTFGPGIYDCFKLEYHINQPPVDHGSYTYINSDLLDSDCSGMGSSGCNNPDLLFDVGFFIDFTCLANNNPLTGNSIDHSRRVDDTLLFLAQESGCGITCLTSDFLNDATNYVTGQPNSLNNLFITEMSDVTRPFVSGQATILNLSFFDLYEQLKETFQLILRANESTSCIEIEHVQKAFENKIKLSDIGKVISEGCCYEVDLEKIPKAEVWDWNEAFNIDFVGRNIEYRDNDGQFLTDTDDLDHEVDEVSADIEHIFDGYQRAVNPVNNLDGFVLTTNTFDGFQFILDSEIGQITGSTKLNAHLSQANLHEFYWQDYRYYSQGFLNNNLTTFDNNKALKKNQDLIIKLCCEDFSNFDLDYKTLDLSDCDCGVGIIEEFDFELYSKRLTLKVSVI